MMASADVFAWLVEATLATSATIVLVLALRRPLGHAFGPGVAYAAWCLVPLPLLAALLPVAESAAPIAPLVAIQVPIRAMAVEAPAAAMPDLAAWASVAWGIGCLAFATHLVRQQRRFMRGLGRVVADGDGTWRSDATAGLPAAIGLWSPRIVMPADAMSRYDGDERGLMLLHEREHIAHGDLLANAAVAVLRCLFWFNPLLHFAAARFRDDQELACDQRVIARHPQSRRAYGEAMLKTQLAGDMLPLGCHWGQTHPLKERIEMLKRPFPSSLRRASGRALVLAILLVVGYTAWATQPAPMATAPVGKIAAYISLRIDDGEPLRMRVAATPGQPFSLKTEGQDRVFAMSGTMNRVEHQGQPALSLEMAITEDGKPVATPKLVVVPGEPASIQIGDQASQAGGPAAFRGMRMEITLADGDAQPVAGVAMPAPAYPAEALKQGLGGNVVLVVDVAADGRVTRAVVDRSEPAGVFDVAALESVKGWVFKPAMRDGKPVSSQVRVPISFDPEGNPDAGKASGRATNGQTPMAWSGYDTFRQSLTASWQPRPEPREDDC